VPKIESHIDRLANARIALPDLVKLNGTIHFELYDKRDITLLLTQRGRKDDRIYCDIYSLPL